MQNDKRVGNMASTVRRVLVTGANGNLGNKLIRFLLAGQWCESVIALDRDFATDRLPEDPRLARITGDLCDKTAAWRESLAYVDGVVHLAAQHPMPDATWADSVASIDMTLSLIGAAAEANVKRIVFASSNHVMGGYKETPYATKPSALTVDLDPRPGTRYRVGEVQLAPDAYAVAKLVGERALMARAEVDGLSAVALRIGWCQSGDNHPSTLSAAGIPDAPGADSPEAAHDLRWFRQMWLSNGDYCGFVEAALRADATRWPTPAIVVNAMSNNAGTAWDLQPARTLLGYRPVDDVWAALGMSPPD